MIGLKSTVVYMPLFFKRKVIWNYVCSPFKRKVIWNYVCSPFKPTNFDLKNSRVEIRTQVQNVNIHSAFDINC